MGRIEPQARDALAQLVAEGLTLSQIAQQMGLTQEATRNRLSRASLRARAQALLSVRDRVQDMRPLDAVDYLLNAVECLAGALNSSAAHPVDDWGHFTRLERRFIVSLYDHAGSVRSYDQLMQALYFDHRGDAPDGEIIKVWANKVRGKIAGHADLESIWGRGYRLVLS